ncbi:MAG: TipAS antibiotic-recognition domain-containing protein [Chloroflexota bacterium]|nr:TipAS antibiotic-recognition domain-containing protein [Chloroflexota bacterium]MDE2907572.1 TipAS antibiotic-recognition domain-containing protein [Chloroflexota bacterium]
MSKKRRGLKQHGEAQQKQYEREARLQYGPAEVNETIGRWNSYGKARQEAIKAEGERIYVELAEALEARLEANDERVREILERWRTHLRHFYEPSLDRLRGLGQLYNSHPDFSANFQRIHPELPAYLERVIENYVDELETAELERMMAEDEALEQRRGRLSQ